MLTIGFVGLGRMGAPMAANLVRAGHDVVGFDAVPGALAAACEHGVRAGGSAADVAAAADVLITMLPNGIDVLDCYRGGDGRVGIVAAARPSALLIDCSTIDVQDARDAASLAAAAGLRAIDAPVSGGVVGATAATLTFMVGGGDADVETAGPLLAAMGSRVLHCGGSGAGQAAKMCNNLILGVSMIAVSEAFVLARALGLQDQTLFDVASVASGQCWSLTTNCPVPGPVPSSPANRDYQPGFTAALMAKDLGLAAAAADANGVAADLGRAARAAFARFAESGGAGLDFSAIVTDISARSGAAPAE
jgi:3-hydroxyisobutyrate dehydrogenase